MPVTIFGIEIHAPRYGEYGGDGYCGEQRDPNSPDGLYHDKYTGETNPFYYEPIDNLDKLFMEHDKGYLAAEAEGLSDVERAKMIVDADMKLIAGIMQFNQFFDPSNYENPIKGLAYQQAALDAFILAKTPIGFHQYLLALAEEYGADVSDAVKEFFTNQSPNNPYTWNDSNGNGLLNEDDPDMDGDWLLNEGDPDMDGDGILNEKDEHPQEPRTLNDIDGDGRR